MYSTFIALLTPAAALTPVTIVSKIEQPIIETSAHWNTSSDAKQALRGEVVDLAIASAQKLLGKKLDDAAHRDFLGKVVDEI